MARTIIIGDIHGCFDEFQALLDLVAPTADDRIIALGDIVDRGPDSEKVLEFFRDPPNAISLMGNHERKHIRSARGETRAALGQKIVRQQLGDRYEQWLVFMETFPRHIELPEAILIHGMFEPGIPLAELRDTVVIGTLTGERYMSEHYPEPWYVNYQGPKPLIVGHHDYLRLGGEPLVREGLLYGIDTGVAHGGRLTALILPEFRIVSVPKRFDKLLILDLDETLVYAAQAPLARPADFLAGSYFVYQRPHVDEFLAACMEWFEAAIWTTGSEAYAARVVQELFPNPECLTFVFASERWTPRFDPERREYVQVKNLGKVKRRGYNLSKVLIVDDSPETFLRNYGNGVVVRKYAGEPEDDELPMLLRFLEILGPIADVRRVEKRGWRGRNPPPTEESQQLQ